MLKSKIQDLAKERQYKARELDDKLKKNQDKVLSLK